MDERPEILLITFGVIAVTLLGQGLTLPLVLRLLRLPGENRWSPDEAMVRLATAQAALDRLEELEGAGAPQEPLERLRDLYRARFAQCVEALGGSDAETGRAVVRRYGDMRRDLIGVERRTLLELRAEDEVAPDVLRRVERDLDLEEARLRAVTADRASVRAPMTEPIDEGAWGDGLATGDPRRAGAGHLVPGAAPRPGRGARRAAAPASSGINAAPPGLAAAARRRRAPRRAHGPRAHGDRVAGRAAGRHARRLPAPAPPLPPAHPARTRPT